MLISLSILVSVSLLPSCVEDGSYGDPLSVYNEGENRRGTPIVDDPEEEEDPENKENPDTPDTPTKDNKEEFLSLSGVYKGILYAVEKDDDGNTKTPENPDTLDVTVKANNDMTFDLAIYNANVTGLELGDLIFEKVPGAKDNEEGSYSFNLTNYKVTLMGGVIEADVDVNGTVKKQGDLNFSVAIQIPPITLAFEGKIKEN